MVKRLKMFFILVVFLAGIGNVNAAEYIKEDDAMLLTRDTSVSGSYVDKKFTRVC